MVIDVTTLSRRPNSTVSDMTNPTTQVDGSSTTPPLSTTTMNFTTNSTGLAQTTIDQTNATETSPITTAAKLVI
jgi:hypothetical protein